MIIVDITRSAGEELAASLNSQASPPTGRAIFVHTDISNWDSLLEAFQEGHKKFGQIDAVCANAGTNSWDDLFHEEFDATGKLRAPTMKLLDINLYGTIYTAKAAVHYFAKNIDGKGQLILTGSAASFFDTPPLYLYCASKGGVLGFMRGLRTQLCRRNITVNMVAPWMTRTPMLPKEISDMWGNLPANDPTGVAQALIMPAIRHSLDGKTLFVAGNCLYELEEGLERTKPQWMGEKLSADFDEGQRRLIPDDEPSFSVVPKSGQ